MRYDARSSIINGRAQIPKAVTEDDEIITMLEGMKRVFFFSYLGTVVQLSLVSNSVFCFVCLFFAAAERRETRRQEEKLLEAAREGDISTLSNLVGGLLCHNMYTVSNIVQGTGLILYLSIF